MRDALTLARRHVTKGRKIVARQHQIVRALERAGLDSTGAKNTLRLFEDTLRIFEKDLQSLTSGPVYLVESGIARLDQNTEQLHTRERLNHDCR
jgi:hypothetical protein